MDILRQRVPFKFSEDQQEIDNHILDEQEQEEIVQSLRQANTASNRQYLIFLRMILGLSFFLQLVSFVDSSHVNPLLAVFPSTSQDPAIPLHAIFTLLSLVMHTNLYLLAFPGDMKILLRLKVADVDVRPLSYPLCYALAAVAPTLSVFLRQTWQSSVWWGLTAVVIFTVQTVTEAVAHGNERISALEAMKYVAHGA